MTDDMTIHEVVADPLIAQVLAADSISGDAFAELLASAARIQVTQKISRLHEERAEAFYHALGGAETRRLSC